jgi:hypothetical protein
MKRRFHPVRWLILTLAMAFVAVLVYRVIAPKRALQQYRAGLEAEGVRLTIAACVPPLVPAHHEAARRFTAAAQAMPRGRKLGNLFPPPTMRMVAPGKAMVGWAQPHIADHQNTHSWADLADDLRSAAPQLRIIHETSHADAFHWNLDYSQGFNLALPHLAPTKNAVQWLQAEAALAMHEARLEAALEAQLTQLRLVHAMRQEDLLIGHLVRIALAAISWNGTWEMLQTSGWTDEQLARLQAAWNKVEFIEAMIHGLETERALALDEFGRMRKSPGYFAQCMTIGQFGMGGGPTPGLSGEESVLSQVAEWAGHTAQKAGWAGRATLWAWFESWADEQFYIETMEQLLQQTRERQAAVRAAAGNPVQIPQGTSFVPDFTPELQASGRRHLFTDMIVPSLGTAMQKAFQVQTQREMARTAIALHRFRLQHGHFPATLQDLVPTWLAEVPCDWMDGAPLRYRPTRGGADFDLYSVGRDGMDHGGDGSNANPTARSFSLHTARDFVWPTVATPDEVADFWSRSRR